MRLFFLFFAGCLFPLTLLADPESDRIDAVHFENVEKIYSGSADYLRDLLARRRLTDQQVEIIIWQAIDEYAQCLALAANQAAADHSLPFAYAVESLEAGGCRLKRGGEFFGFDTSTLYADVSSCRLSFEQAFNESAD